MKAILLAAGSNGINFPIFIDKPKCLYKKNGETQIDIQLNELKKVFSEKDIIVVVGYKGKKIEKYLKDRKFKGEIIYNKRYKKEAIYSILEAIKRVGSDDIVITYADEKILGKNIKKISSSTKKMCILQEEEWPYYSVGIFKLKNEVLDLLKNENYVGKSFFINLEKFLKNGISEQEYKNKYNFYWTENSGVCIGFIVLDLIRIIGKLTKISYIDFNENIDVVNYDSNKEYEKDLDTFKDTDEYKNSKFNRFYFDKFSNVVYLLKKIIIKIRILMSK